MLFMCCLLSIFLPFPLNALSNILEYIYAIFDACAAAGWPKNVIDIILTVNLTGHLTIPFDRLTFECLKPLNANEKRFGPTNIFILGMNLFWEYEFVQLKRRKESSLVMMWSSKYETFIALIIVWRVQSKDFVQNLKSQYSFHKN